MHAPVTICFEMSIPCKIHGIFTQVKADKHMAVGPSAAGHTHAEKTGHPTVQGYRPIILG